MAEEAATGRIHAIGTAAEIDLVQIQLEDLVLRKFPFERHRQHRFAQLAIHRTIGIEEDIARQLLGNGGCRADAAVLHGSIPHRPPQTQRIDTEMLVVSPVLDAHHGVLHHLGYLVRTQPLAIRRAERDDLRPVTRADQDCLAVLAAHQRGVGGHVARGEIDRSAKADGKQQSQRAAPYHDPPGPPSQPAALRARLRARRAIARPAATAATAAVIAGAWTAPSCHVELQLPCNRARGPRQSNTDTGA